MTPSDDQYRNGFVGPFALRAEKVGLGVLVGAFACGLLVLVVLRPGNPTFLYVWLLSTLVLAAVSACRLRSMQRQDEQD